VTVHDFGLLQKHAQAREKRPENTLTLRSPSDGLPDLLARIPIPLQREPAGNIDEDISRQNRESRFRSDAEFLAWGDSNGAITATETSVRSDLSLRIQGPISSSNLGEKTGLIFPKTWIWFGPEQSSKLIRTAPQAARKHSECTLLAALSPVIGCAVPQRPSAVSCWRWSPYLYFLNGNYSCKGNISYMSNSRLGKCKPQPVPESHSYVSTARYNSVQMKARERMAFSCPKRHQVKHLEFFIFRVRDQGVGGSNLSPDNLTKI